MESSSDLRSIKICDRIEYDGCEVVIEKEYIDDKIKFDIEINGAESSITMKDETRYVIGDFIINSLEISNSHKVNLFTSESTGLSIPKYPRKMNYDEVKFIIQMVQSELGELASTVSDDPLQLLKDCIGTDFKQDYKRPETDEEIIIEQADAFADVMAYIYNACSKVGIYLDRAFSLVHKSNMNKKWSDGKFHRRESDGKVIKPPDWEEIKITINDLKFD